MIETQQSPPGLSFNVSHSGEHCIYALAWGRQVGIDIEVIRSDVECLSLAERFFTPAEYEDLQRTTEPDRPARFFQYWTCKEAYLKARGIGLSSGLAVEGTADAEGAVYFVASGEAAASHWLVRPLRLAGPVAAAVGGEGTDWSLVVSEWIGGSC